MTSETREAGEVLGRANISGIFDAALTGKLPAGAERELQEQAGLDGNAVPLALLRRHEDGGDLERRTTGVTARTGFGQHRGVPIARSSPPSSRRPLPPFLLNPTAERSGWRARLYRPEHVRLPRRSRQGARIKATARRLSPHPS